MMRVASLTELRKEVRGVLKDTRDGPVVLTRNGRPEGILVNLKDSKSFDKLFAPKGVMNSLRRDLVELAARRSAQTSRRRQS